MRGLVATGILKSVSRILWTRGALRGIVSREPSVAEYLPPRKPARKTEAEATTMKKVVCLESFDNQGKIRLPVLPFSRLEYLCRSWEKRENMMPALHLMFEEPSFLGLRKTPHNLVQMDCEVFHEYIGHKLR